MLVEELFEHELDKYHLGGREPPKAVGKLLLTKMRVPLRAIWDKDLHTWYIYRLDKGMLTYQCTFPYNEITLSIKEWLEKKDTSKYGTKDDEERKYDFKYWFNHFRVDEEQKRQQKKREDFAYRMRDPIKYCVDCSYQGVRPVATIPSGIAAAKVIAVDPRTGKRIYAVPKQEKIIHD